jgi:hypothetical protein
MKLKIVTQSKIYWKNEKEKEKILVMSNRIPFCKISLKCEKIAWLLFIIASYGFQICVGAWHPFIMTKSSSLIFLLVVIDVTFLKFHLILQLFSSFAIFIIVRILHSSWRSLFRCSISFQQLLSYKLHS